MPTTNSARTATGILPFMDRYSNTIREVGQNGRRGALMITISVHHPQVVDFAKVKLDAKRVTGANISIRLSDEFLKAVENDEEYEQRWPVDSKSPAVSKKVKARDVWNEIIKCAHARAEPGLLFWDNAIRESPADCYDNYRSVSTNPCAELVLSPLDSCRLLVVNFFSCVISPFLQQASIDFAKVYERSYIGQRLMDDLVDLELECVDRIINKVKSDPEAEEVKRSELELWVKIRAAAANGRRTGLGPTAIGDTLAAVSVKYGSDESVEVVEKLYRTMKLAAYRCSVDMAKELGAFPEWNKDKEKNNPFLLRIRDEDPQLYKDMQKYGRRNIACLTTAPVGSVSLQAGPRPYFGSTSGIEPLFRDAPYTRRKKINHAEKGSRVDFVDVNGDKWTEFPVFHPKLKMWMDVTGEKDWKKSPYHGACAEDIDWKQRVKIQAAAQRHVDHAISSTVNLPETVSVEKVAEIYETAWKAGCKGITVYRDKCRDGVLVDAKPAVEEKIKISKTTAPKRPKQLVCDVHHTTVKGEPCTVFIGKLDLDPYEVFALLGKIDSISDKATTGVLTKDRRGQYTFEADGNTAVSITELLTDEQAALTRMVSTALRHGADVNFVVHQLEKSKGQLTGFSKAVARVLKKYIAEGTKVTGEQCARCSSNELARQEGCLTCHNCGWSKCN
jgi:ribonucleoside-diphosphate reductase alpha chain